MDEMEPDKHRNGKKGGGREVNQTLAFQMVLQIIVGFSTFQVSQSLEILKYLLIQHMYPSTCTTNGQENTMYEQNSLHENYQNQNSLKTRTRFICEFPPS